MRGTYILISRKDIEYDETYLHVKTDIAIHLLYKIQSPDRNKRVGNLDSMVR